MNAASLEASSSAAAVEAADLLTIAAEKAKIEAERERDALKLKWGEGLVQEWWDAVFQKRLAWAFFFFLLLNLVCCQPTELISAVFFVS